MYLQPFCCYDECVGLRQLAMTHLRLHDTLLVPWVFEMDMLQQLLRPGALPADLVNTLYTWLIGRHFHELWQSNELIQLLSSCCFMCDFRDMELTCKCIS